MFAFGRNKRKADDFLAPAPAAPPGQRVAEFKNEVRALNDQFAAWTNKQAVQHPDRLWDSFCSDYLKYSERLRQEFADVIECAVSPADPAATTAAAAAAQNLTAAPAAVEPAAALGTVFLFGQGDMGQLGLGDDVTEMLTPGPLSMPGGLRVSQVVCGGMHSLAITEDGHVWSWGVNDECALGREARGGELAHIEGATAGSETVPERVKIPGDPRIKAVTAGDSHSAALSAGGEVFAWGVFRDSSGRFGFAPGVKLQAAPLLIRVGAGKVAQIASGADHIVALAAQGGQVYTWGCAECGRLGRVEAAACDPKTVQGDKDTWKARLLAPAPVTGIPPCRYVAAGLYCSFAVGNGAEVFAWGLNQYGQLAIEAEGPFFTPAPVPSLSSKNIVQIGGGEHHTIARTENGEVYSFGRPTYGRLGRSDVDGNKDDRHWNPGKVAGLDGAAVCVAGGLSVSGAVTARGTLFAWGTGGDGLLAKGDDDADEHLPRAVGAAAGHPHVVNVSFGGQHAAMLATASDPAADAAAAAPFSSNKRRR